VSNVSVSVSFQSQRMIPLDSLHYVVLHDFALHHSSPGHTTRRYVTLFETL